MQTRRPYAIVYALIGLGLGIGAPAGAMLVRFLFVSPTGAEFSADVDAHRFFYWYMLAGTCTVFAIAGWFTGRRAERSREREAYYQERSEIDALTGLLNAGAFRDRTERAFSRAAHHQSSIALLLIDVDRLKQINDECGHQEGNAALRHVSSVIGNSKRAADDAARWGGDEFALLLEDADRDVAERVAESIVQTLKEDPFRPRGSGSPVTVTIGVASAVPWDGPDVFFAAADRALYAGKRKGRNRVEVARMNRDQQGQA